MTQRELTDDENVEWSCIQAYAGLGQSALADVAAAKVESDEGTVPVVCTPSGGAQSVRLTLPRDWHESLSDEELLAAIHRG